MHRSFFIILLFAGLYTNAQVQKEKVLLGGNFDVQNTDNTNSFSGQSEKNIYLSRAVNINTGYFLDNKNVIGVLLNYGYSSSDHFITGLPANNKSTSNFGSVGLFVRHYIPLGTSGFYFFGQFSAYTGKGNTVNVRSVSTPSMQFVEESRSTSQYVGASFYPGLSYFVTKKFALEGGVGNLGFNASESRNVEADGSETTGTSTNFNFSLRNIYIGFNFYL